MDKERTKKINLHNEPDSNIFSNICRIYCLNIHVFFKCLSFKLYLDNIRHNFHSLINMTHHIYELR